MLKKIRDVLNTYSDSQLEEMDLWVDCKAIINYMMIQDDNIVLLTDEAKIKIDDYVEQEGKDITEEDLYEELKRKDEQIKKLREWLIEATDKIKGDKYEGERD